MQALLTGWRGRNLVVLSPEGPTLGETVRRYLAAFDDDADVALHIAVGDVQATETVVRRAISASGSDAERIPDVVIHLATDAGGLQEAVRAATAVLVPTAELPLVRRIGAFATDDPATAVDQLVHGLRKPTLSVLMPNFNDGPFLRSRLESILAQSWQADEVIVVDDGSTDDSWDILQSFADRPNVHLLRNPGNKGINYSNDRLLERATGDYISWLSANDVALPGFFEKSMSLLQQHPQAGMSFSFPSNFDDTTGVITECPYPWGDAARYITPDELVRILGARQIGLTPAIVKRSTFLETRFEHSLEWHADLFITMVIALRYGICYVPETLTLFRIASSGYSKAGTRWETEGPVLAELLRLLKTPEYADVLPLFKEANALAGYGPWLVSALLSDPGHWDLDAIGLVRQNLIQVLQHDWAISQYILNPAYHAPLLQRMRALSASEPTRS